MGASDPDALAEQEAIQYFMINRSYWVRMQNVYSQWQRGTLNDADWEMYNRLFCTDSDGVDSETGLQRTYSQHEYLLTDDFRAYVRDCWNSTQ